ncbi:MAG: hypothetical protein GX974_00450 [Clostridiales bacterium]|nr:hypothetical protein [Clostridiales bacterium]
MGSNHTIYILLTYSGTLPSKVIKRYTREPYSHVSIALDIELTELYSFGRLRPYNPIYGGFVREDIIYGTYGRFPQTSCALYSLTIDEYEYIRLKEELYNFVANSTMYRYNFLGLFGIMIGIPIQRSHKYFCSQFVATLLVNCGVDLFHKSPALVSPMDFRKCSKLNLIYEGNLRAYKFGSMLRRDLSFLG